MRKMKDFFTKKMIKNLIYYALCFLAVVVTPYLAAPIAPLWDWAGYGLMRQLFHEAFTVIFWALELVAFYIVKRKILDKRFNKVVLEKTEEPETGSEKEAGRNAVVADQKRVDLIRNLHRLHFDR